MIDYGKPASNQCEADLDSPGAQLMRDAREWVKNNPDVWDGYKNMARSYSKDRPASPNLLIQLTRNLYRVSLRNSLAPALARIAMEEDERIKFRVARSKVDGFCEVVL